MAHSIDSSSTSFRRFSSIRNSRFKYSELTRCSSSVPMSSSWSEMSPRSDAIRCSNWRSFSSVAITKYIAFTKNGSC
jgi:hypothetical protein